MHYRRLCSLSELASIYSEELGIRMDNEHRRKFIRIVCSVVCDLVNYEHPLVPCPARIGEIKSEFPINQPEVRVEKMGANVQQSNKQLSTKSIWPSAQRRIVLLSRDEVIALNSAAGAKTRSVDADSDKQEMDDVPKINRKPRKSPVAKEEYTYRSPLVAAYSNDQSFLSSTNTCRNQTICPPQPGQKLRGLLLNESVQLSSASQQQQKTLPDFPTPFRSFESPILSALTKNVTGMVSNNVNGDVIKSTGLVVPISQSTIAPLSSPSVSLSYGSVSANVITPLSGSVLNRSIITLSDNNPQSYIAVKRQLSEAVVSIRRASSRLIEET
ncbi:unnamed protein product [Calicophoron daubneyi]|uniref:Uncharacterized protein n=1 Tax=Calicophoron daubneyi TaxID=300641 RepID=A0AAV2TTN4_CALDB